MNRVKENLNEMSLYELRAKARILADDKVNGLDRTELMTIIKNPIPISLSTVYDVFYDSANHTIHSEYPNNSVQSPIPLDKVTVRGFVHMKSRGASILFASDMNTYKISLTLTASHGLGTGDHIEAIVSFDEEQRTNVVQEILSKDERSRFDDSPICAKVRKGMMWEMEVELGKRTLVVTDKTFSRPTDVMKTASMDVYQVALLLDEGNEYAQLFAESGIEETFIANFEINSNRQVALCLYALFSAKYAAITGHDVIMFIDNLPKMVRLYNKCISKDGSYNPGIFDVGAMDDVKQFLMAGKCIKGGGSLTPVIYLNTACTEYDRHIYDEFSDIAQRIIVK